MRNLRTKQLFVAGFVFFLISSNGGNDVCLADPTDTHPLSSVPEASNEADIAADVGMTNLIRFVQNDKERAASIGFSSAEEVTNEKMKRGSGIPVLRITDERLLSKPDFKNISEYLEPLDQLEQFIYPITVEGKARAVINVRKLKKTGKWKAVSYGAPGLVSGLEELKLLKSNRVFIARYVTLGIWLACTDLDDKSHCQQIKANSEALDYKKKNKIWPKREPAKDEQVGETGAPDARTEAGRARPEAGLGGAEPPGVRAETGPGRADAPGIRPEPGLGRADAPGVRPESGFGRPDAPDIRPEVGLGRTEAPPVPPTGIRVDGSARAEVEGIGADKKEKIPLVIIGDDAATVLRSLADVARKRKPYESVDRSSDSNHR